MKYELATTNARKAGETTMEWIIDNLTSVITGAILLIIVVLIVRSKIKERKQGGCGCGCPGCTGSCPHSAAASIKTEEIKDEA